MQNKETVVVQNRETVGVDGEREFLEKKLVVGIWRVGNATQRNLFAKNE